MCNFHDDDNPFGDLGTGPIPDSDVGSRPKAEPVKHACEHCGGSGRWSAPGGHVYGKTGKCYACNGRGHFLTDAKTRRRNRVKRRESVSKRRDDAAAAFEEQNPGLIAKLTALIDWNSFAQDLQEQFLAKGFLTEGQVAAANKMIAKIEANRSKRDADRASASVEVDLSPIRAMFEKAVESGRKKPTYRAEGLLISLAPASGRNAGALYVKAEGSREYGGKIVGTKFLASREAAASDFARYSYQVDAETVTVEQTAAEALRKIAESPEQAAVRYGAQTGSCSICGRELTDPESVARGIGPICAGNFF